jgi:hypothetical protein
MKRKLAGLVFSIAVLAANAAAQTVTGSGTTNTVPVFTGTSAVGNSPISVSGGNVGIGVTAPNASLEVLGSAVIDGDDTSLTSTQLNGGTWAWNGLIVGSTNPIKYSGIAVGGALRNTGYAYNGLVSFHNFAVNSPLAQTRGAQIGAVPDDTVATDIGMNLQFSTLQSGVNSLLERMRIASNGNVGIGTTNPTRKLHIAGDVQIDGALYFGSNPTAQALPFAGISCTGADYAESVDVTGDRTKYEPGDVLVIDPSAPGKFLKASQAYSTLVAGIYSTKPGFVGRKQPPTPETIATEVPMAMVGRVPTKVTAENGPIKVGDLLVASSTSGRAMKGTDRSLLTGAVIGKALGALDSGTGVIEVLVTLQ